MIEKNYLCDKYIFKVKNSKCVRIQQLICTYEIQRNGRTYVEETLYARTNFNSSPPPCAVNLVRLQLWPKFRDMKQALGEVAC